MYIVHPLKQALFESMYTLSASNQLFSRQQSNVLEKSPKSWPYHHQNTIITQIQSQQSLTLPTNRLFGSSFQSLFPVRCHLHFIRQLLSDLVQQVNLVNTRFQLTLDPQRSILGYLAVLGKLDLAFVTHVLYTFISLTTKRIQVWS